MKPRPSAAVLEDLTCDSDGRIDQYVERGLLEPTLPVHELKPDETYLLGVFMAGAYQETLGDIHNLFGDTDSVDVIAPGRPVRAATTRACGRHRRCRARTGRLPARELMAACRAQVAAAGLEPRGAKPSNGCVDRRPLGLHLPARSA